MDSQGKRKVFIDEQIPIERQIDFLRNWILERDFTVYSTLKEILGEEGEQLHHLIKIRLMDKTIERLVRETQEFDKAKKIAGYADRILGYRVAVDSQTAEEMQLTLSNCPYFEKAKEYGLEKKVCKLLCDFEVQQAKARGIGELTVPAKIGEGAKQCVFKLKRAKQNESAT